MKSVQKNHRLRIVFKRAIRIVRPFFLVAGIVFTTLLILSLTDLPYYAIHYLGTDKCSPVKKADVIVVMGAGGIPGSESLLRCYYAAQLADSFPESRLIVAFPVEENTLFDKSENFSMIEELLNRGIQRDRITSETTGTNTFSQVREISKIQGIKALHLVVVTSPEHMMRCILTFRKQGFGDINGHATFEQSTNDDSFYEKGTKKNAIRKTEQNLTLRYNLWSYLQYEIKFLRECFALAYYKLAGYI